MPDSKKVTANAVTFLCRDDKIRTCDPQTPSLVRYRTALRPETGHFQDNKTKFF